MIRRKWWLRCFVWWWYTQTVWTLATWSQSSLVKGVGCALKWAHLLSTDCPNALRLTEEYLWSGSLWMKMSMILYWGCQTHANTHVLAQRDRSAHSLKYWECASLQQMARLASLQRLVLHYSPAHIKEDTTMRYEKTMDIVFTYSHSSNVHPASMLVKKMDQFFYLWSFSG